MDSMSQQETRKGRKRLSRRGFLSLTAIGLVGAAASPLLAACGSQPTAAPTAAPAAPAKAAAPAAPAPAAPAPAPTAAAAAPAAAPAAAAKPTVVHLATVQPITGSASAFGTRVLSGAQLAVKEINDAGGFKDEKGNSFTLNLTSDDMANTAAEAVALFRKAAGDSSVLAMLGPSTSVGFLPMIPLAKELSLPLVGAGASALVKEWNPWVNRINLVPMTATPAMYKVITPLLKLKRVAVIYEQTQEAHVTTANIVKASAATYGYQVVAEQVFSTGDQDFSAQVAAVKAQNPEAIHVMAATAEGPKLCLQIRNAGVKVPLITDYGAFLDAVYWDNSKGAIEGAYDWLSQDFNSPNTGLQKFLASYKPMFPNITPNSWCTFGYDAVYTAVAAIKKSGSGTDREKFRAALSSLEYSTPLDTKIAFKNPPNGENLAPSVVVIQITGRETYKKIG